ncbi:MAG: YdiU family protein [Gemmatimonadetes bacterium]|nr:YdiU family protein [Gemmatimonadota bacterium]MBT6145406.1 YdiU family protein [Gemmatimonadota bacterium]MBT7862815.1 YdiU family protein [Gemmatimonadota bacterium]
MSSPLEPLIFDNRFTLDLPADPEVTNQRRQVMGACYSRVLPKSTRQPELVAHSHEVAQLLDLTEEACASEQFLRVFSGNEVLATMDPYATCYGGHQFGNWAGQLGDGRAINLGEIINGDGERWALQLKGAGPTPYSRTADGLAVLRSSVREFLCSEAMHHLGVPTTRALSLTLTGDQVLRDMFYDGHPQQEPGAVVCRVAPSFTRFGSFEIFASRQEHDVLRQLLDYTIRTDFRHLPEPSIDTYLMWFDEVCRRTAAMIVHWMRVGFVHGVMNTDNLSVLGLTIDYGPYGWLEDFDPEWTPNTTDAEGRRYRFGQQPQIAQWNLAQLARALAPIVEQVEPLQESLMRYSKLYNDGYHTMMARKLGLTSFESATDMDLISELQSVLQLRETDMTLFYRALADLEPYDTSSTAELAHEGLLAPFEAAYYQADPPAGEERDRTLNWMRAYVDRVRNDGPGSGGDAGPANEARRQRMNAVNPKYVLRNYLAQLAIDKSAEGDHSMVQELLEVLRKPYDEQPGKEAFAQKRPEWARHRAGCSMLSCSS